MFKNANVVMLPTDQKATNKPFTTKLVLFNNNKLGIGNPVISEKAQHLYITSDEEIKEGDWYIVNNRITQCSTGCINEEPDCKKIIATTDTSLFLPQLSQAFIQHYIEEYNKGNVITRVLVEYEDFIITNPIWNPNKPLCNVIVRLKIYMDNTITIKKVKDSWSRKEVVDLCWQAYRSADTIFEDIVALREQFNEWLEKNL